MAKQAIQTLNINLDLLQETLDKSIDDYIFQVQIKAREFLARGIPEDEILKQLIDDVKNNTGEFKQLTGQIGTQLSKVIDQTAIDTSQLAVAGLSDNYRWDWEPGAEHCDTCSERNGQIKTWQEWQILGMPAAGTTICTIWCKCSLMPV